MTNLLVVPILAVPYLIRRRGFHLEEGRQICPLTLAVGLKGTVGFQSNLTGHKLKKLLLAAVVVFALASTGLGSVSAHADPLRVIVDIDGCNTTTIPANDDGSSGRVDLPFSVNFYGSTYDHLWVNNNGNVTFMGPLPTYTPFGLIGAGTPIIAPFFADVDTRGVGSGLTIYGYGETSFEGHDAFCVNWINVGYFSGATDKLNSFQLLIVDRPDKGVGAFDTVFNYDKVQWEAGSASGGNAGLGGYSARAGFASGRTTAGASLELQGSGVNGAFLDNSTSGLIHHRENSTINGRYVYAVRNGTPVANNVYVALGDSYQSGEGDFANYLPGTDQDNNLCHRSPNAYPKRLVESGVVKLKLDFVACSGAEIPDPSSNSVSTTRPPWNEGSQLDHLDQHTRLVTIGIGGNDAGFKPFLTECVILSISIYASNCEPAQGANVQMTLDDLNHGAINRSLRDLYRTIRAKAPYARVIVVSYPKFFPETPSILGGCGIVKALDQQWLNDVVIEADGSIGIAAVQSGFDYLNMEYGFEGHEACDWDPWINQIVLISRDFSDAAPESFHPNSKGHQAIANYLADLIGTPIQPTFVINQNQTLTRSLLVSGTSIHVSVAWPGSDVVTSLISPSGVRFDRTSPHGATHENGATFENWDIDTPEQGTWGIEIYGADVAPAGEGVQFVAEVTPQPNARPTAAFLVTGSGPTYHLSAAPSSDPDGSISQHRWIFDDGTIELGVEVDHTFASGTESRASLQVTDDGGLSDFATSNVMLGDGGSYFAGSMQLTNSIKINGNLHVDGDFSCNSNGTVVGDLVVTGKVTLTNNCAIGGSVYANGNVTLTSTPLVAGSIVAVGSVSTQSTAKIGHDVYTAGIFSSNDGKTVAQLNASGALGGDVFPGSRVETMAGGLPAQTTPADYQSSQTISWTQFMNQTARANNAPSWSQGLTANPGCTMASWGSSVNGSTVSILSDTVLDATSSGCATVSLQTMTVQLSGDLTIYANGFSTVNGTSFTSADGAVHRVSIVTKGARICGSAGSVSLSNNTTQVNSHLSVDAAGKLIINGVVDLNGKTTAGCFAGSGSGLVGAH